MFYKELTDAELRREYRAERRALANQGELARNVTSPRARRMLARQTAGALRRFELICAIARKRGADLLTGEVAP